MSDLLEEIATVARVEGATAWVSVERRSACAGCQAQSGCGAGALSSLLGQRPMLLPVANRVDAQVGDRVVVGLPGSALLRAALGAYLLPLITLLLCAGFVSRAGGGDALTVLGALLGLGVGLWLAGYWLRHPLRAVRYRPQLLRRADLAYPVVAGSCKAQPGTP